MRTCEVWRARCLVVADANIVHHPEFKPVSVSAEQWVPVVEKKPGFDLVEYLTRLKEEEGYMIVGLEQTLESVGLQDFRWPEDGKVSEQTYRGIDSSRRCAWCWEPRSRGFLQI